MDSKDFDQLVKQIAAGATSRRVVLKRLAGGAVGALGGLFALRSVGAQPGCRQEGHPCEGNQVCCPGLECRVTGPGNAARCARPVSPPPPKCKGYKDYCSKSDECCSGCCKDGYCKDASYCKKYY